VSCAPIVRLSGVPLSIYVFGPLVPPETLEGEVHKGEHVRVTDEESLEARGPCQGVREEE
jgi:hypothetical protein